MGLRRKEDGSIVVEASLIMPIFLSFVILLITMIRISIVEIELNHAVSEATKQISVHMYPIGLLYDGFSNTKYGEKTHEIAGKVEKIRNEIIEAENKANDYSAFFPQEVKNLLSIRKKFETGVVGVYDSLLARTFQPIVDSYVDDQIIQLENLQVTKITLPNLKDRDQVYFGINVRYDMPLHIPFINKIITFKQQAYERVWVGNQNMTTLVPASPEKEKKEDKEQEEDKEKEKNEDNDKDKEDLHPLVIDSIASPVQRGRKVRIIAKGPPDQVATIQLMYQSGFEKEKKCTFSSDGWLLCDIKIGGNSKEGTYEAIIKVDGQTASGRFEVMSKGNMKKYRSKRKSSIK
jgi:hypothetical protein